MFPNTVGGSDPPGRCRRNAGRMPVKVILTLPRRSASRGCPIFRGYFKQSTLKTASCSECEGTTDVAHERRWQPINSYHWSGRRDLNSRPAAWEAAALPLSYIRVKNLPVTCSGSEMSFRRRYVRVFTPQGDPSLEIDADPGIAPGPMKYGAGYRARTGDHQFGKLRLYH